MQERDEMLTLDHVNKNYHLFWIDDDDYNYNKGMYLMKDREGIFYWRSEPSMIEVWDKIKEIENDK